MPLVSSHPRAAGGYDGKRQDWTRLLQVRYISHPWDAMLMFKFLAVSFLELTVIVLVKLEKFERWFMLSSKFG